MSIQILKASKKLQRGFVVDEVPKKSDLPVLLNRSQLARKLCIAMKTLAGRIERGEIKPVAIDGKDKQLFAEEEGK